jgi:hypothetical protein
MLERLINLPLYTRALASGARPAADAPHTPDAPPPDAATPRPTEAAADATAPRCVTKLVRNYRSHAALLELPSRVSYGSELQEWADRGVTGSMTGAWQQYSPCSVATSRPILVS